MIYEKIIIAAILLVSIDVSHADDLVRAIVGGIIVGNTISNSQDRYYVEDHRERQQPRLYDRRDMYYAPVYREHREIPVLIYYPVYR